MDEMQKAINEMSEEEYIAFCNTLPFAMVDFRNVEQIDDKSKED